MTVSVNVSQAGAKQFTVGPLSSVNMCFNLPASAQNATALISLGHVGKSPGESCSFGRTMDVFSGKQSADWLLVVHLVVE